MRARLPEEAVIDGLTTGRERVAPSTKEERQVLASAIDDFAKLKNQSYSFPWPQLSTIDFYGYKDDISRMITQDLNKFFLEQFQNKIHSKNKNPYPFSYTSHYFDGKEDLASSKPWAWLCADIGVLIYRKRRKLNLAGYESLLQSFLTAVDKHYVEKQVSRFFLIVVDPEIQE